MMNYYYFSLSKHRKIKWIVNPIIQKQPSPVGILQNGDLKNFAKLRGKFLLLEACNVTRESLWHRFLQVNIAKFLRTPISKITSVKQLLIKVLKTEFLCKRNFPAIDHFYYYKDFMIFKIIFQDYTKLLLLTQNLKIFLQRAEYRKI